jgi:hypothetical protein
VCSAGAMQDCTRQFVSVLAPGWALGKVAHGDDDGSIGLALAAASNCGSVFV